MAQENQEGRSHIFLSGFVSSGPYQRPPRAITPPERPEINRAIHGAGLVASIQGLQADATTANEEQVAAGLPGRGGIIIEFRSFGDALHLPGLEDARQGIEVLNVRHGHDGNRSYTLATVFVPHGRLTSFEEHFRQYAEDPLQPGRSNPRYRDLSESIAAIRRAAFDALWNDPVELLPADPDLRVWWEVWLPVRNNADGVLQRFRIAAMAIGAEVGRDVQLFPERMVTLLKTSKAQLSEHLPLLDTIAELRKPKSTAEFFTNLTPVEQREWVDHLKERSELSENYSTVVCLIDTGLNDGHPLIGHTVRPGGTYAVDPGWHTGDEHGHGTELAGLAIYGDLSPLLDSNDPVHIEHRLESVKLLRQPGDNDDPRLYGHLTGQAVARPEVDLPHVNRVFSLAVTTGDDHDRGRPSSWSAAIDRLAFNPVDEGAKRLIVVCAGNVDDGDAWKEYPQSNQRRHIHDPGQAWNVLTVGAYTAKALVAEGFDESYSPIAPAGGLSPFSTTGIGWDSMHPLKPDVVMEGGNVLITDMYAEPYVEANDKLMLLSCANGVADRLFSATGMTSAATALCARFAAQLMAKYPDAWPETVRALVVHSAEWTEEMKRQFLGARANKADHARLVQHVGMGVPNLERALESYSNSLVLIAQESIQPYRRDATASPPRANEVHYHELPWPKESLEQLHSDVRLKVTLSYFIEPNPGVNERGYASRYSYESFGLRFDVKRGNETVESFARRVSALADASPDVPDLETSDPDWRFGQRRNSGSIHTDVWEGSAAELAARGVIAVFPASGWWKTRTGQRKWDSVARYSLVVSIHAPEVDTDLYAEIVTLIEAQAAAASVEAHIAN